MKPIIQDGDPALRGIAELVPPQDIKTKRVQEILTQMQEALAAKETGVALAAPQIGVPLRMFIISDKVFEKEGEEARQSNERLVYINPEVVRTSKRTFLLEEACLSVEGFYGKVQRARNITVRAYDENGVRFTRGAGGLLAQIFQHEIDHLDGVLYTDRAKEVNPLNP